MLAAYYLGFWLGNQGRGGFGLGVGSFLVVGVGGIQGTQAAPDPLKFEDDLEDYSSKLSLSTFSLLLLHPSPYIALHLWDKKAQAQAAYMSLHGHLLLKSDLFSKINTARCSDNVRTLARVRGHVDHPLLLRHADTQKWRQ